MIKNVWLGGSDCIWGGRDRFVVHGCKCDLKTFPVVSGRYWVSWGCRGRDTCCLGEGSYDLWIRGSCKRVRVWDEGGVVLSSLVFGGFGMGRV